MGKFFVPVLVIVLAACSDSMTQDSISGTWTLATVGGVSAATAGSSGTLTITSGTVYSRSTSGLLVVTQGFIGYETGTVTKSGSNYTFHSVSTTVYTMGGDGRTLSYPGGSTAAVYGTIAHTYTR